MVVVVTTKHALSSSPPSSSSLSPASHVVSDVCPSLPGCLSVRGCLMARGFNYAAGSLASRNAAAQSMLRLTCATAQTNAKRQVFVHFE